MKDVLRQEARGRRQSITGTGVKAPGTPPARENPAIHPG